jgi:hypothetical protein
MSEKIPYWQLLQDPRWQKKRLQIMERDNWECKHCRNKGAKLNVHHYYYISKRMPWDYPDWALITVCDQCHEGEHGEKLNDFEQTVANCLQAFGHIVSMDAVGALLSDWRDGKMSDEEMMHNLRIAMKTIKEGKIYV